MLKNIRLHLEKDEEKQALLEEKLASTILQTQSVNLNSFTRNIPSLVPLINSLELQNHSLFCNKYGEINIVDYGLGRTLYGFHPQQEVETQVEEFFQHGPYTDLITNNELEAFNEGSTLTSCAGYQVRQTHNAVPESIECLVVLGCGLGYHILELIKRKNIKFLIIYEPEPQYFKCSALVTPWNEIFDLAKTKDTQLFIQVEKDGRDLISDINELKNHAQIEGFYLYKHHNHSVFNSIEKQLITKSWKEIDDQGINFSLEQNYNQYIPTWTPPLDISQLSDALEQSERFTKNLAALKKYFPNIYQEFKQYTPQNWVPATTSNQQITVLKKDNLASWYSDQPKEDCFTHFDNFNEQPNKDGLVLGYSGTKLAHYIHFQFVKETEALLEQAEEEVGALPDNVASIIMFGIGVGYQLEKLLADHTVEKLFLCEPNRDFFYASLFAIDWQAIFEKVEQSEARIYFNIGDDGTNLFRDLLSQFYAIGPYILSNTYFYQSYYNASLNSAIAQLREQLQIVISMGEYFDHAYYGIEHTKEGMRRKTPILVANPSEKLSYDDKEVPVFIVGNGPSLDSSIKAIKEWKEQAIVVSCGTTLQALHRHGITPDFHAEIEQNRSTFDWAVLIGDLDYLKNITLISCNGIHPDTCDLYKDVLIAFKEGESSTVSALNILGKENYQVLLNAFPTVSNFACDLFSQLGFSTIYLIGVDLGFVSVKHHHSKSSGYYKDDGEETFDYAENNNTSLIVPGNFRPTVNTKHEFKVSRQVIEQVTSHKPKDQAFFNCSDGAKIEGTLPIRPDDLLIVSTDEQKQHTLTTLKTQVFSTKGIGKYVERFEKMYSQDLLMKELEAFETLLEKDINSQKDVDHIINKQKEMLFDSYQQGHSLLFYYLYGTVNYANAMFTKLSSNMVNESGSIIRNSSAISEWKKALKNVIQLTGINNYYDASSFKPYIREKLYFPEKTKHISILIVSHCTKFKKCAEWILSKSFPQITEITITGSIKLEYRAITFDYVLYYQYDKTNDIKGLNNTMLITHARDIAVLQESKYSIFAIPETSHENIINTLPLTIHWAIQACLSGKVPAFVIPKLITSDPTLFDSSIVYTIPAKYLAYDFLHFLCVYPYKKTELISATSGTRGKLILGDIKMKQLLLTQISSKKLDELKKKHNDFIENVT